MSDKRFALGINDNNGRVIGVDVLLASDHDRIVSELRKELKAARADAERYRWLKKDADDENSSHYILFELGACDEWDAAIDKARTGGTKGE